MADRAPSYMMQHGQPTLYQQPHYDMSLPSTSNQPPPNGMQPTPPYYPSIATRFPPPHHRVQQRHVAPQFTSQSSSIYVFTSEMANDAVKRGQKTSLESWHDNRNRKNGGKASKRSASPGVQSQPPHTPKTPASLKQQPLTPSDQSIVLPTTSSSLPSTPIQFPSSEPAVVKQSASSATPPIIIEDENPLRKMERMTQGTGLFDQPAKLARIGSPKDMVSTIPVAAKSKNHHVASPQLCPISNGQQQHMQQQQQQQHMQQVEQQRAAKLATINRIGKFLPEQALPDPRMHQIMSDGPPPQHHMFLPNQYIRGGAPGGGDTIGQMLMPQSSPPPGSAGDQDWHRMRHEYEMSKTMHHHQQQQQSMMSTKGPRMMHPSQLHDQHQQRYMHPDEMHYRNAIASRVPAGYCMPPQQQQWSRMMQPGYADQSNESMLMNGGGDVYGPPPPTVNTYHVNATIQQMNIQNVGAPMLHAAGGGMPSMNVQQMNIEQQQHQQARYRPAGVPPMHHHHHPGQPNDPNTMGAVYDYASNAPPNYWQQMPQPLTNLDTKIPSQKLQYFPQQHQPTRPDATTEYNIQMISADQMIKSDGSKLCMQQQAHVSSTTTTSTIPAAFTSADDLYQQHPNRAC